mmetsp:Transcript_15367/g.32340  ORF Transcript_15367/g.32340 Transcript_15367/m.32340 type:complete len:329 (-) Transcript_15367:41-1027(-)
MLSAGVIVLEYVCPLMGCIFANLMFSAPFNDVRSATKNGTLGCLNPTPWAMMTGNCSGWVTYSYLIQNHFVFWANAPGLVLSIWLNMAAVKLQYCDRMSQSMRSSFVQLLDNNRKSFKVSELDRRALGDKYEDDDVSGAPNSFANLRKMALDITIQKIEAPAPHEKVVVGVVIFWLAIISFISFLKLDPSQRQLVVGIAVNINLLFFYGAPLSTIFTVIRTRDSSSIHRRTMVMNTMNGIFWTAFGFGTVDYFISVPNGLGAILGFVQMFMCLVMPCKGNEQHTRNAEVYDLELGASTSHGSSSDIKEIEPLGTTVDRQEETQIQTKN